MLLVQVLQFNPNISSLNMQNSCLIASVYSLIGSFLLVTAAAYDALDPKGNITIKWDLIFWTHDSYAWNYYY